MKSILILLAICLSLSVQAQIRHHSISLSGGPGWVTQFSDNSPSDLLPTWGYTFRIDYSYQFSNGFSLRSGFNFDKKGSRNKVLFRNQVGQVIDEIYAHDDFIYGTIPILVQWGIGKRTRFTVQVGGYFGYLFLSQNWIDIPADQQKWEHTDYYERVDMGLRAGLGLEQMLSRQWYLIFEADYQYGLTNVNKDRLDFRGPVFHEGIMNNSAAYLTLGVRYYFGKFLRK